MIERLAAQILKAASEDHTASCAALGITLACELQAMLSRPAVSEEDAITAARQAGHRAGYDAGYDAGYCDGRADAYMTDETLSLADECATEQDETVYSLTPAGLAQVGGAA